MIVMIGQELGNGLASVILNNLYLTLPQTRHGKTSASVESRFVSAIQNSGGRDHIMIALHRTDIHWSYRGRIYKGDGSSTLVLDQLVIPDGLDGDDDSRATVVDDMRAIFGVSAEVGVDRCVIAVPVEDDGHGAGEAAGIFKFAPLALTEYGDLGFDPDQGHKLFVKALPIVD